jgi:hypothetical protein
MLGATPELGRLFGHQDFAPVVVGHASVQTTERYLGCKQKLSQAVNHNLGLEFT